MHAQLDLAIATSRYLDTGPVRFNTFSINTFLPRYLDIHISTPRYLDIKMPVPWKNLAFMKNHFLKMILKTRLTRLTRLHVCT